LMKGKSLVAKLMAFNRNFSFFNHSHDFHSKRATWCEKGKLKYHKNPFSHATHDNDLIIYKF
jgi:hypothetical protein